MVSALSSINSGFGIHRDVLELQSQLQTLQKQLASGKKSETYGGLGTDRLLVLSLRERIGTVETFTKTIDLVQIRLDAAQVHLDRIRTISAETRTDTFLPDFQTLDGSQTSAQASADAHLNEILSLLNARVGDRFLFSGRTTDVKPTVTSDILLNGDGTGAGFKQIISERRQADLGASGLGRLAISSTSPTVTLSEDGIGHPFGIKLTGVSSTLTGTSVTGPAAAPATVTGTIDLGVDQPAVNAGTGQSFIGNETLQSLGFSNGETITITTDAGTTTHTIVDATTEDVNAVIGTLAGNGEAGVALNAGNLEATASNNITSITFGGTGDISQLGLTTTVVEPSNATVDALTGTATLEIGTQGALTLDFDSAITNRAQLEAALAGLTGGTATINGSNFIEVTAGSGTEPITIGGTADVALGLPDDGVINPTPTGIDVTFSATLPQPGQSIRATFTLPDGSQEIFELTATASSPPDSDEFLIGVDETDTASNFEAALNSALQTFASSKLASASTAAAANDFFFFDNANPPQRVDGPPFDSATALRDATATDTIRWYRGDNDTGSARSTAIAHVDDNLDVGYGLRANETPFATVVSRLAMLAAETFDASVSTDEARYAALTVRVAEELNFSNKTSVENVITELGYKQRSIQDAQDRHSASRDVSLSLLQEKEGTDDFEVSAKILRLQTQISTSFEVTSLLSQLSLVNFLR